MEAAIQALINQWNDELEIFGPNSNVGMVLKTCRDELVTLLTNHNDGGIDYD